LPRIGVLGIIHSRTGRPIAERHSGALNTATRDPKISKELIERGADPVGSSIKE